MVSFLSIQFVSSLEVQNFVDYLHTEVRNAVGCWESLPLKTVMDEGKQCKSGINMKFILTGIVKEIIFCEPYKLSLQVSGGVDCVKGS